jgi:LAO/AO transport system kinase
VNTEELLKRALDGDERSLAHLISAVVDGHPAAFDILGHLYRLGGRAHVVGITGAPGAGKSTLVSQLVTYAMATGSERRIGEVAVDPSSPFSGGAILGDRIRMGEHSGNPNVFIRSVANRGHLGGIASTTPAVVTVLDGVGYEHIFVETVGVGQAEVEIASATETTVVVVNPGWGDSVQTAKAGFLEIADVFVVNKADRPETDRTIAELKAMLDVGPSTPWIPPILSTVANTGQGVEELVAAIEEHQTYLLESGMSAGRRENIARHALVGALRQSVDNTLQTIDSDVIKRLADRASDPWTEAAAILTSQ